MLAIRLILAFTIVGATVAELRTVNSKFKYKKTMIKSQENQNRAPVRCSELPAPVLNDILGPAFNSRYMSIESPKLEEDLELENAAGKRRAQDFKPFYVDDTYAMEISDKPAWEVTHLSEIERANNKRSVEDTAESQNLNQTRVQRDSNTRRRAEDLGQQQQLQKKRPWECEAKIKWQDLGESYYPRYLRTVECTRHACFYGHYSCTPRSFTVKILRRRVGECVATKNKIGINGLHGDLKELWIWEERAVNFCCDCSAI